jgi:hypothetical protein
MDPLQRAAIPIATARTSEVGRARPALMQLEDQTLSFFRLAEAVGPLTSTQRRATRPLLECWDAPPIRAALAAMASKQRSYYLELKERLADLVAPPLPPMPLEEYLAAVCWTKAHQAALREHLLARSLELLREAAEAKRPITADEALSRAQREFGKPQRNKYTLSELVCAARACLAHMRSMGRRYLLPLDKRAWRGLEADFYSASIKAEILTLSEDRCITTNTLTESMRELFDPDNPATKIFLRRRKPLAVAEMYAGNYELLTPVLQGVSIRRPDKREQNELVEDIVAKSSDIELDARMLSLVRNRGQDQAKRIAKLSRRLARLGKKAAAMAANGLAGTEATLTGRDNGVEPAWLVEVLVWDLVMIYGQKASAENGLYTVTRHATPELPFLLTTWTRPEGDCRAATQGPATPLPACIFIRYPAVPREKSDAEELAEQVAMGQLMADPPHLEPVGERE